MSNKLRYFLAVLILTIGFLPMADTALLTSNYIPMVDYIVAMAGFLLACHITETHTIKESNNG